MSQYNIYTTARHSKYVFLVDQSFGYNNILNLIYKNLALWGGRFNPIIPVDNNVISKNYLDFLIYYNDPDIVYYSNGVDIELVKKMKLFNPCEYLCLDNETIVKGVNSFYLISQYDDNRPVLIPSELWNVDSPLKSYFRINYDLRDFLIISEIEQAKNHPQIEITSDNFNNLSKILIEERPLIQSSFSAIHSDNSRFTSDYSHYKEFEIVLAKDESDIKDLIYYWNRIHYDGCNFLYIKLNQLDTLIEDDFWSKTIENTSCGDYNSISVSSFSLNKDEIQDLIERKFKKIKTFKTFVYKNVSDFPFEIKSASINLFKSSEPRSLHKFNSEKSQIMLSPLSFVKNTGFGSSDWSWCVDMDIFKSEENGDIELQYPLTTASAYFLQNIQKSRIRNEGRGLSFIVNNHWTFDGIVRVAVPHINSLVKQLISSPVIGGQLTCNRILDIKLHDASRKLKAFLNLFDNDFFYVENVLSDKVWMDLFENLSTSTKIAGDSISFNEILNATMQVMENNGLELGQKGETYQNIENLELGLKNTMQQFCNSSILFNGFNIKCTYCSSKFWYDINSVKGNIQCKGCNQVFKLPIELIFHYKLNDLIKNNIYQIDRVGKDGNLTVIRTLALLERESRRSFQYVPQIELFDDLQTNKPFTDLDIFCISDGKLIIGEAKHNSKAFKENRNKALESLVEVSNLIHPDILVLTCSVDESENLAKAEKGLKHLLSKSEYVPEIRSILLSTPGYSQLNSSRYFYY